jgi:hypothetical protein
MCKPSRFILLFAFGGILSWSPWATAAPISNGEIGTISKVDGQKAITFVPWGKAVSEAKDVSLSIDTQIDVVQATEKKADLQPGMWIKFGKASNDGVPLAITAGHFVSQDKDKIVIFQNLPAEFLSTDVKDWYTNEAGGVKFKIQVMRSKTDMAVTGLNLRPASYQEPAGGFVFYWPQQLKGAVLNYEGAKPGVTTPDADGKITITKDTVTESYWKHPKNPNKLDAGYTTGLTELTVRKMPSNR